MAWIMEMLAGVVAVVLVVAIVMKIRRDEKRANGGDNGRADR